MKEFEEMHPLNSELSCKEPGSLCLNIGVLRAGKGIALPIPPLHTARGAHSFPEGLLHYAGVGRRQSQDNYHPKIALWKLSAAEPWKSGRKLTLGSSKPTDKTDPGQIDHFHSVPPEPSPPWDVSMIALFH